MNVSEKRIRSDNSFITRCSWWRRSSTLIRESLIRQLDGRRCRVSCDWPHKAAVARTARRVGECWYPEHSTDHASHNLFISPVLQNPVEVLETLAHELIHVAAGPNVGHKGAFVRIAKSIGFKAPWTSTPATPALIERLNGLLVNLGPYPHAAIDKSRRKKQGTRLLKVVCGDCGYTIRTTRQWIDTGLPTCACGSEMEVAN